MREFDIFVPLFLNDGTPISTRLLQELHTRILDQFDGLTYFPQPNKGVWKMGGVLYEDEIVIYRVLSNKARVSRRFLSDLKRWMKSAFEQEEILIVEREVDTID